jgi:hypothetical protein
MGFAAANNIAMRFALSTGCDYVFLLNNDMTVHPKFLGQLVKAMERDKTVGAVMPKIYYYKSNIIQSAGEIFYPGLGVTAHIGNRKKDSPKYSKIRECNFLCGTILISKEVINKVGLLDQVYFLYCEDLDYAMRIRRSGYKLLYVPKAMVWHKVSKSVRSLNKMYYKTRNIIYLMKKFDLDGIIFWASFWLIIIPINIKGNLKTPISAIKTIIKAYKDSRNMKSKISP